MSGSLINSAEYSNDRRFRTDATIQFEDGNNP